MICPRCQAQNRPGALFCAQCQARLTAAPPTGTMKVCPTCHAQNRLAARFCVACGHTFSLPAPGVAPGRRLAALAGARRRLAALTGAPRRQLAVVAGAAGLVVALGLLALFALQPRPAPVSSAATAAPALAAAPTLPVTPPPLDTIAPAGPTARPTTPALPPPRGTLNWLDQAQRVTVQIMVPIEGSRQFSVGSGSIITRRGHILTNYHVVGDKATGRLLNAGGAAMIALSASPRVPPTVTYRARVSGQDAANDLAVLRIESREDGARLPADLGLGVMPIGDSDSIDIGDQLTILGFPGVGGETLTLTRGFVSGFLTDENWIKTDAEINSGNSGGPAVNALGEQVGVVSAAVTSRDSQRVPGKLGLVRPIKVARTLIEQAKREVGE